MRSSASTHGSCAEKQSTQNRNLSEVVPRSSATVARLKSRTHGGPPVARQAPAFAMYCASSATERVRRFETLASAGRGCQSSNITFTRARPYRKNDQCHVEQKNGSVVRRWVGSERFEGVEARRVLAAF